MPAPTSNPDHHAARSGGGDARAVVSDADPGYNHEQMASTSGGLDNGSSRLITVVFNPAKNWLGLYIDGFLEAGNASVTIPLTAIDPGNCFIGRSLYSGDPYLNGSIDEFRIHNVALSSAQVAASFTAGPGTTTGYDPGTVTDFAMSLPAQMRVNAKVVPFVSATYTKAGPVQLGVADVTVTSSNTNVVEVLPSGTLSGKAVGTATITASLGGKTSQADIAVQPAPVVLMHRYSFSDSAGSATLKDSVGTADGTVIAATNGTNRVVFNNGKGTFPGGAGYLNGAYIDLPGGIISSLNNLSIELWATWNGPAGTAWPRYFDFGNSAKGDSAFNSGSGTGSFFLTPYNGANQMIRFDAASTGFTGEQQLDGTVATPIGQEQHIVCIFSPDNNDSQLWVNGQLISEKTAPFPLANLQDVNNWLGQSNW